MGASFWCVGKEVLDVDGVEMNCVVSSIDSWCNECKVNRMFEKCG